MLPGDPPASSADSGLSELSPRGSAQPPEDARNAPDAGERRHSGGRRRASDRLFERATGSYPQTDALSQVRNLENLILFIDDDLRETALGLRHIEDYLLQTLQLLERPRLGRAEVRALASDDRVLGHVDAMVETLESLRRRLARLGASLR